MRARSGQVAIYLVLILVALAFMMLMNVGAYLAVTAKNRAMNAGDSAASVAAAYQGELLKEIGELNLEHLKLLGERSSLTGETRERIDEIAEKQCRLAFLGPLKAIRLASEAAARVGAKTCSGMCDILMGHVNEVRTVYAQAPELYPEPWEGAWEEYATELQAALGGGLAAGPDNIDFRNAATGHMLLNKCFYSAVDGRCWCWFKFNAMSLLESYTSYHDWAPLPGPSADGEKALLTCANCEIFSLHLESRVGSALDVIGKDVIVRLTGWDERTVENRPLLKNKNQVWYFFDDNEWRTWWEIDPDGEWKFPVVGKVKPEFDVKGCAAICRVYENIPIMVSECGEREIEWSAGAKPFATLKDARGSVVPVTDLDGFVAPAEWDARLVPIDTVGGKDLSTADYAWMKHVKEHLPKYLENGPTTAGCGYCNTLYAWEQSSLRRQGLEWLKNFGETQCSRCCGGGTVQRGGTPHGH